MKNLLNKTLHPRSQAARRVYALFVRCALRLHSLNRCPHGQSLMRPGYIRLRLIARFACIALYIFVGIIFSTANLVEANDLDQKIKEGFESLERWQFDDARKKLDVLLKEHPYTSLEDLPPELLAYLGAVKMHLGDYTGAVWAYEQAKRQGAPKDWLYALEETEAAQRVTANYTEEVHGHFVLRFVPGRDTILIPYAVETLETAVTKIGTLLGWKSNARTIVEFYPSAKTLADVSSLTESEIQNSGTIALCRWNRLMVTSPRGVIFGYSWRDTLAHELTHLIIGQISANTVPIWLHEGLAKYAETGWRTNPGASLSDQQIARLYRAARAQKLIPFERMHPSMAKLKTQEETSLAFAEVHSFIGHLLSIQGWQGIRALIAEMKKGARDVDGLKTVYGKSFKALEQDWKKKLIKEAAVHPDPKKRAKFRTLIMKKEEDVPEDELYGITDEARRYARVADLLYARGRFVAAKEELKRAVKKAPEATQLNAKLSMMALASGDLNSAEEASRHALSEEHPLAGPHLILADILIRQNKSLEALSHVEQAAGINPFDPRVLKLSTALFEETHRPSLKERIDRARAVLDGTATYGLPKDLLGTGALIWVDSISPARVFVKRSGQTVPTLFLTPTAPFALRPGQTEFLLYPMDGPPLSHKVLIQPGASSQTASPPAQRIDLGKN